MKTIGGVKVRIKRKHIIYFIMSIMIMALLAGCGDKTVTKKDREGNEFTQPKKIEKIVSASSSNTEILAALGLGDKIICTDKYSDDIDGLREDRTKIDFMNINAETIISLEPDIVIASTMSKSGSEDPLKSIKDAGIPVVYMPSSKNLDGIYDDITFLSDITGTSEKGKQLVKDMKKDVEDIKKIGDTIKDKKKVYFEIGSTPGLYSFGKDTFLNELINIIGAENIFANETGWIAPSEENVISDNPDVILTNETYIPNAVELIKQRPGWENVNAIKNNKVFLIDQNSSSRSTQNVVKALKEMAKAIYPEQYE